ncbi:polysaccharide biosynthesis/export family protein [Methylorubrum extorquens]
MISGDPTIPTDPQELLPHALINATPRVASITSHDSAADGTLGSFVSKGGAADIRIGIGDTISVTIFEAAAGGLFIPDQAGARAGNFVTLPDQQVDRSGTISVPYAGLIPAVGRRAPEVQAEIEQRLRNRAIEPQAVVAIKDQKATQISVLGEVNLPSRLAINPSGERVLDAIARAGGPKGTGYQSFVTLQRGSRKRTVYFNKLVREPSNNVYVQPGDVIFVYTENRSFVVLGATGLNGKYNFEAEQTTASEALGRGGGLLDERANPATVFIYRLESRPVAAEIGIDVKLWPSNRIPVLYQFDLRAEDGLFTLRQFLIRDKDILYVSNAPAAEYLKVLTLLRVGVATVNEGNIARYNLGTLR